MTSRNGNIPGSGVGHTPAPPRRLGMVVGGSLSRGLDVRLDGVGGASLEDVAVGSFVTIVGKRGRYFAVITDLELRSADDSVRHFPPDVSGGNAAGGFMAEVISGTLAYGQLSVMPGMTAPLDATMRRGTLDGAQQTKTIPEHFSPVYSASQEDIDAVFTATSTSGGFALGSPQGMEAASIHLDLGMLASRSVGVFGASGSGKTFLARMLLAGLVKQGEAVSLVFDMESEYGWQGQDNDRRRQVKGLKQLFPSRVVTFTLDEQSSRRRGATPDGVVRIGYDEIEPADIEVLRDLLNLSEVAAATAWNVERRYGRDDWLRTFLGLSGAEVGELADDLRGEPVRVADAPSAIGGLEQVRIPGRKSGRQRVGSRDNRASSTGQSCGPGVRTIRQKHRGVRAGQQPAHPADSPDVGSTKRDGRRRAGRGAAPSGDFH